MLHRQIVPVGEGADDGTATPACNGGLRRPLDRLTGRKEGS